MYKAKDFDTNQFGKYVIVECMLCLASFEAPLSGSEVPHLTDRVLDPDVMLSTVRKMSIILDLFRILWIIKCLIVMYICIDLL